MASPSHGEDAEGRVIEFRQDKADPTANLTARGPGCHAGSTQVCVDIGVHPAVILASKSGGYGALLFADAAANQYAAAIQKLLEQALDRILYRTNSVDAIDATVVQEVFCTSLGPAKIVWP